MPSWRPIPALPDGQRLVVVMLAGGLAAYAVFALAEHRWVSGLAAPVVAVLLAVRHSRARFSAYVFFSALALRGLVAGAWPLALFAVAGVLVLQTAPATRAWPRLVRSGPDASPSTRARDCSRMSGP
jgi:hypothetical protein